MPAGVSIRVTDDGPGLSAAAPHGAGVGLTNTRARLQQLYPDRHEFQFIDRPGGGVAVLVVLPYATADQPLPR